MYWSQTGCSCFLLSRTSQNPFLHRDFGAQAEAMTVVFGAMVCRSASAPATQDLGRVSQGEGLPPEHAAPRPHNAALGSVCLNLTMPDTV